MIQETVEDGITDLLLDETDVSKITVELVDEEIVVKKDNSRSWLM